MLWLISSCAGGGYRERRITTEECEEITDRNTIARRLGYSDFEANDSFRDDFCFDRECSRSARPRTEDGGKPFIYPLPRRIIIFVVFCWPNPYTLIWSNWFNFMELLFLDFTCALIFGEKNDDIFLWKYFI